MIDQSQGLLLNEMAFDPTSITKTLASTTLSHVHTKEN
jgi:hypothetical protein